MATARTSRGVAVLDSRLALNRAGLAFAAMLAREADVWFSREFVSLINPAPEDNDGPLLPGPHDEFADVNSDMHVGLDMWRTACANGWTLNRFCWMGDTPAESVTPTQTQPALVAAFDALISTLNPEYDLGWSAIVTCGLQSLAIAASLSADMPVIFTVRSHEKLPALCADASKLGIAAQRLPEPSPLKALAMTQFGRAVNVAALAGVDVAALWLVAPRANLVTCADYPPEFVPDRFRLTPAECLPWEGAKLYWTTFEEAVHAQCA